MKTIYIIKDGHYYCEGYTNDFYFKSKKEAEYFLRHKWNLRFDSKQELYCNDKEQKWASILPIRPYDSGIDL
jgi:hypothetical protein